MDRTMHGEKKSVILVAMPFAGITIPSIQLAVLETYCRQQGISIETRHLYLKAAELYGLQNYHTLIYPPYDSYTAQMAFSRYVFPENWEKNQDRLREYYNKQSTQQLDQSVFSFDEYIRQTDIVYRWILDHLNWQSFDLIGFTLNYGQLLPSLAIAKKIKEQYPEKKIILGGSRTAGPLGVNVLRTFEYVDIIVSGDGEDALTRLASQYENHQFIPQVIYRTNNKVKWNTFESIIDLDTLPIPSYDQFYTDLHTTSSDIQRYYQYYGRLPVEINRGCWWNRCTFCNLNIQHHSYREKTVNQILKEIQWLSERYHMMDFQLIGNTLLKTEYRTLFEKLKDLGRDFSFFVESRAGQLTSDDYRLMKEAGFTIIQTGIESFSKNYLRKMNKGTRVIDNIAALKFCKENGIRNTYNLLVRYPNEEIVDFEETKKVVHLIQAYLDAPQYCELRVMQGSDIQRHPDQFNIERLKYASIDQIMYPPEYLEKGFTFVYDFKKKNNTIEHPWELIVEEWKKTQEKINRTIKQTMTDELIFYFVDGGTFIKIYDKRNQQNIKIFVLNELERRVLLSCIDVVSFAELQKRFHDVPEFKLSAILQSFEQTGLVFAEDEHYLCLPLRSHVKNTQGGIKECIVNIST